MKPPSQSQTRSRLLDRLIQSSVLSLSLWSMGLSDLGILYASAQIVPATVRTGYGLVDEGLVNQAIALFEQAVRQYPQSLEAQLGLAIAYRRAGRDADAVRAYERALTIDPTNRLALLSLGTLGGYRPEWQNRGIAALTTLLEKSPDDTEARTQRALLYIYEGQFNSAIADYEQVLQKNPKPEVIVSAAQAYAYDGKYERSLDLFDRYRQAGGAITGDAAIAYARVLRETGNPTAAVQALETPLRQQASLNGLAIRMRAEQAVNYAALGRFDQATALLAPLKGRADARMVLARALVAIGQPSYKQPFLNDGIALYKSVLAEASTPATVKREIAGALASFPESLPTALQVYQQLGAQQPDDRGIQTWIAVLEYETRQSKEADLLARLAQILQTIPSDKAQQQSIAEALIQLKMPNPRLIPLYENLVRAGMAEPLLYFRIAQMYLRQKNYTTARSVIATYQKTTTGKTDAAAELILAAIDQRQGNMEASIRRYQSIIDSNPRDKGILSGALQGLAGIYQSQGQFKDALALYNRVLSLSPDDSAKQLGQAGLQYQAGIMTRSQAEAILNHWLMTQSLAQAPPELYGLVATLPASPAWELLYRTLLQTDPSNLSIQTRLAEALAKQNTAAAKAYVDQLIANDPDNVDLYFLQGHVAQETGNQNQAVAAYEEVLKRDPRNISALAALGGLRFQQRRFEAAIDLYSRILEIQPKNPIARSALSSLENVRQIPRRIPALQRVEEAERAQQQESSVLPDLSRLQSPQQSSQSEIKFAPQGDAPLPWEHP